MQPIPKSKVILAVLAFFAIGNFANAGDASSSTLARESFTLAPSISVQDIRNAAGDFMIGFPAGSIASGTSVFIEEADSSIRLPWRLDKLSKVYQFDIPDKASISTSSVFSIEMKYSSSTVHMVRAYFFDKKSDVWKPLPTKNNPTTKTAEFKTSLTFAQVAVFSDPDILISGKASWYKYKTGDYTASPDFAKGSVLRVYNTDNGRYVDVEVNDYGPERNLFPDRVVDLEKTAFAKIAPKGSGIANVRIEYLGMRDKKSKKVMPAAIAVKVEEVSVGTKARSAMLVNEQTGEVIFEKNSTTTLPLASLTKLVAMKVFLDTKPDMGKKVKYDTRDEEYNFKYVDHKWEAARLSLKNGDTMTINDLVHSSLMASTNNTVETLVRVSGMERGDFIRKMNETVSGWGASSTRFVEPTGLSPQNVSSSRDYAIITKEVYKNPVIQKASTLVSYKLQIGNAKKKKTIRNSNFLVEENKFRVTGSKTGYLNEAGYCLMTRVKSPSGSQFTAITLGAGSRAESISDTRNLLYYALNKNQIQI